MAESSAIMNRWIAIRGMLNFILLETCCIRLTNCQIKIKDTAMTISDANEVTVEVKSTPFASRSCR